MNKKEIDIALKQVGNGDNKAFENLYLKTRKGVYAFLLTYFSNPQDCEDVMQTVYLKIKMNISQYKGGTNGLAWILQIAKNTALNTLRKKSTSEKPLTSLEEDIPHNQNESISTKHGLLSIMSKTLTEEEQKIIILHVIWGYKHKEIAKLFDCPTGTITSKYKRAVDKIKKEYKEKQL